MLTNSDYRASYPGQLANQLQPHHSRFVASGQLTAPPGDLPEQLETEPLASPLKLPDRRQGPALAAMVQLASLVMALVDPATA